MVFLINFICLFSFRLAKTQIFHISELNKIFFCIHIPNLINFVAEVYKKTSIPSYSSFFLFLPLFFRIKYPIIPNFFNGTFLFFVCIYSLASSLSFFEAVKEGFLLAGISNSSPVCGLRPFLAARSFNTNVPNPEMGTFLPSNTFFCFVSFRFVCFSVFCWF